jgi:hypothetical protein
MMSWCVFSIHTPTYTHMWLSVLLYITTPPLPSIQPQRNRATHMMLTHAFETLQVIEALEFIKEKVGF